jgi:hypothetical protein
VTSQSVLSAKFAVRNTVNFTSDSFFRSKNDPGQWVCWDFQELRVRPTHYTIKSAWLRFWVVESSLDGEAWTEIDRKKNNKDFMGLVTAWFDVSNSAGCCFIRLTQTGKKHDGNDILYIQAFDVFGTLLE